MNAILTQVSRYLASQTWQVAVLVVVVAVLCWTLRKTSAHWRYLLWLVVLVKCLVPPVLTVPVAVLPEQSPVIFNTSEPNTALPEPVQVQVPEPPAKALPPVPSVVAPSASRNEVSLTQQAQPSVLAAVTSPSWLAIGWMVGVSLYLLAVLYKAYRTHRQFCQSRCQADDPLGQEVAALAHQLGIRHTPPIWLIEGLAQPFVWGLVRGSVYLPASFAATGTPDHRRGILMHELAHVARFDAFINFFQTLAQGLFFFHPLVWWANARLRQEREKCCDEIAIARLGAAPRQYSTAIVDTLVQEYAESQRLPSLAVAGPVKNIEDRIKTIMAPNRRFYVKPSQVAVVTVLFLAALTVPTALVLTTQKTTTQPAVQDVSLPATSPKEDLAFGPVIERVVYAPPHDRDTFLDLETGKLLTPLEDTTPDDPMMSKELNPQNKRASWAKSSGADVMCYLYPDRDDGKLIGLFGFDMAVVRSNQDAWENLTPRQVADTIGDQAFEMNNGMRPEKMFPHTFLLETREGSLCVLQIMSFTENPKGVKLRYKMAPMPPDGWRTIPAPWIALAPSEETVPSLKDLGVLARGRYLNQDAAKTGEWEIRTADNKKRVARIDYSWEIPPEEFLPDGKRIIGGTDRSSQYSLSESQLRQVVPLERGDYLLAWYVAGKRCSNVMQFRIDKDYDAKSQPLLKLTQIEPGAGEGLPLLVLRAYRHTENDPAPRTSEVVFPRLNVDGQDRAIRDAAWRGDMPLTVGGHYAYILDLNRYTRLVQTKEEKSIEPGKKHVIFAKVGSTKVGWQVSNHITLSFDRSLSEAWDHATADLGPALPTPQPPVLLSGTVIRSDGKPAAGYSVHLFSDRGERFTEKTDEQGLYTFGGIPAGSYKVETSRLGAEGLPRLVVQEVLLGKQAITLTLSLQKKFSFSGRVTYPDGTPAPNWTVYARWPSPQSKAEYRDFIVTDAEGRYTLGAPYEVASYVDARGTAFHEIAHRGVKVGRKDVDFVVPKTDTRPHTQPATDRTNAERPVDPTYTRSDEGATDLRQRHTVLEILDRPAFRDAAPVATEISFEKYGSIKAEYAEKNEHYEPGYAITYRRKEADDWRGYWLTLESFDDDSVWIAELTQYKSKGWDWIARYRLKRSPEVDEEFGIHHILEERSKVLGGVKYGMAVDEMLAKKGKHYKVNHHAASGSADLIYNDVKVSVSGWEPGSGKGRVVSVEPTTERMKEFMKNVPYKDEK